MFVLVDRIAAKRAANIDSNVDASIQVDRKILPRLFLLIPALLLVIWIIRGASLMRAGMIGIFACIACDVVNYFVNKEDFIDLKGLWNCCVDGAKQAASIAIPTAACGIIINVVTGQTSLATNLSNLISALGTENLFVALLIAMVGCMILGMALPTVAAYLVGTILFVPCIRPILLQGTVVEIVIATAQMALGTYFLAITVSGFFKRNLKAWERIALFAAAICLIAPEVISTVIGIVLGLAILSLDSIAAKKAAKAA